MKFLYLDDSYIKEFKAVVTKVTNGVFVELDSSAFYPVGGGQPFDTGKITRGDSSYNVVFVKKFSGVTSHEVDKPGLFVGDSVTCLIDWSNRYKLMRSHTASHVLSSIMHNDFGAKITGNQLSFDKIRIDFNVENFDRDLLSGVVDKANDILSSDNPVSISYMNRDDVLADSSLVKLASALPPSIDVLRIVTIGSEGNVVDSQADGGTHVKNTLEVGKLKLLKLDNKGKNNRRMYVCLED